MIKLGNGAKATSSQVEYHYSVIYDTWKSLSFATTSESKTCERQQKQTSNNKDVNLRQ